jgi:hypothetical protein
MKHKNTEIKKIGMWINTQRTNKKINKLTEDKITKLEELSDWQWEIDNDKLWLDNYNKLKKYLKDNDKNYPSAGGSKNTEIKKIGYWINHQRRNKKKNKYLTDDRITKLEELPYWQWEIDNDEIWLDNYNKLEKYLKDNDNNYPSTSGRSEDMEVKKIGRWISHQRENKKKNKLTEDKITKLEELPDWQWEKDEDKIWLDHYTELKKYLEDNDNIYPSMKHKNTEIKKIGVWINRQRQNKKKNKLTEDKIIKLEELPDWYW